MDKAIGNSLYKVYKIKNKKLPQSAQEVGLELRIFLAQNPFDFLLYHAAFPAIFLLNLL